MFRKFFLLFTSYFLLLTSSFSQGYLLKGKIKGWHDTVCFLGNHFGNKQYVKDTVRIDHSGNFAFKGKEKLPGGIYLVVLPNKVYFEIIIDKEQDFSFETDTANFTKNMKVKGSEENILFYKYLNFISDKQKDAETMQKLVKNLKKDSVAALQQVKKDSIKLVQEKLGKIDKEVEKYKMDFIKDHPDKFLSVVFKAQKDVDVPEAPLLPNGKKDSTFGYRYFKEHYFDNLNLSDERLLRTPVYHMKLKYYFDKLVLQHPDSIIKEADMLTEKAQGNKETFKYLVYYATYTYETSSIMGMDAVFVHEVEKYYMTKQAYWIDSVQMQKIVHRAQILKPLLLGKSTPPLVLQDTMGKDIFLYAIKANYTILFFWDPDCGHCQKIAPKLKELYDKIKQTKGVEVYGVCIEQEEVKWKKFIREKKLNWLNVRDQYKQYYLREMYDIYSTPVIYLLDDKKIIKAKRIDVDQVEGFIDHLEKVKEKNK